MNKGIVLSLVFLFVLMSFTSISGIQLDKNTINPSGRGNTLYVGGSGEGNYTKIQDAIDNASDGDTVFVFDDSSPYNENLLVEKSISLIGEDRDTTVINGNDGTVIDIEVYIDEVNINGFTIETSSRGISIEKSENLIISDNHFLNCYIGIDCWTTNECFIISNSFKDCNPAIWIGGRNIMISNNYINSSAEPYMTYGDITCWGTNIVITNNTLITNGEGGTVGISLQHSSENIIDGNEFNGYSFAIYLYLRNVNINIAHNNIINSYCGVLMYSFSHSNSISKNNFINNSYDVLLGILTFNNVFDGNYWDKWIGVRYPLPIFQKLPKFIYGGGKIFPPSFIGSLRFYIDWNPASEPYNYTTTQGCDIE
jgi:parallel beta-helix repeat protein